jgi:hypothetical protein
LFLVPQGKLSALQQRILVVLSPLRPSWTLTGGAALAGFHTKHRETRDLDLFFTSSPADYGTWNGSAKQHASVAAACPLQTSRKPTPRITCGPSMTGFVTRQGRPDLG